MCGTATANCYFEPWAIYSARSGAGLYVPFHRLGLSKCLIHPRMCEYYHYHYQYNYNYNYNYHYH